MKLPKWLLGRKTKETTELPPTPVEDKFQKSLEDDFEFDDTAFDDDDDYVTFKFLEECLHEIRWYAVDCLGNTELLQTQQHRVDDTPPETLKNIHRTNLWRNQLLATRPWNNNHSKRNRQNISM